MGFPCGSAGKEFACNVGDLGLIPGVGKIPWRRERLLTPVFWSGEFHGPHTPGNHKEYIMRNARLDEAQTGIEIARRNISNLRSTDNTILLAETKRN